jgi:hypothetical protein
MAYARRSSFISGRNFCFKWRDAVPCTRSRESLWDGLYAPEVWVSRPESPASNLEKLGIHFVGEEEYDCEILIHEGVSEAVVHILPDPIVNTEQEVEEVAREMLERHSLTVESQTAALAGGWRRPGQVPWLSPIGP